MLKMDWYSANLLCIAWNNCKNFCKFLNKSDNVWWVIQHYLLVQIEWLREKHSWRNIFTCTLHSFTSFKLLLYKGNLNLVRYGQDTEHVLPEWNALFCYHFIIVLKQAYTTSSKSCIWITWTWWYSAHSLMSIGVFCNDYVGQICFSLLLLSVEFYKSAGNLHFVNLIVKHTNVLKIFFSVLLF